MELVIGVDAGGTTTRCVAADLSGRRLGEGHAPGLNQNSSGGDAVGHLGAAIRAALGSHPPSAVRHGVLAVAGAGAAGQATAQARAEEAWRAVGLGGSPEVVPDILAGFVAGSDADDGLVLVAGTGAVAAAIHGDQIVARADGYGWLLGDVGSAVWLAREGLTAALAGADGRAAATVLTTRLFTALDATTPQHVVGTVYSTPPAELGRLAPVVTRGAEEGDPTAADIVARGVAGLLATLDAVHPGRPGAAARAARAAQPVPDGRVGPVVLGGALLASPGPVRDGVWAGLAQRGLTDVHTADEPVMGSVRLALRRLAG